ncbi:lysine N(6)-hydroxylase/L-ornithine N(5)-oxygenase family protein [Salinisphaera sp. LB1]|uniref:lysine N(6)-hydroxylase/L-ornithine N(5)-oxygenase family protein n=1 Tax=Salinisphaera sp. LB1 TaxID=2183911 RepID=UPI000D708764|nr:SidA/IucD/PvdA family monooxygenase [Salinisphaera sp. LB1]AWN17874.1 Siderophore biosynthesis protein, monooxygenase [Salinisphaera sp. LB1]
MVEHDSATHVHDVIGIGIGPFNLGLAALCQPIDALDAVFLDENERFDWHPGLLLDCATMQTPFLADLVTLADPTSRYSFLNYLKASGRIYAFYIRESFFMLRAEYTQYCRWVAGQLSNLVFEQRVEQIDYDEAVGCYRVIAVRPATGEPTVRRARRLVLGTGPARYWPAGCDGLDGPVCHAADYLAHREALADKASVTLIGSGQSAAEVFHERLASAGSGQRLDWFTRSSRFFAMAYDKLTLELTSPEYIDYFHGLPEHTRHRLGQAQKPLYKGIDRDLSDAIYERLYEKDLHGSANVGMQANTTLLAVTRDAARNEYVLDLLQAEQGLRFRHRTQALILATGFSHRVPGYLEAIADRIRWDGQGRFRVSRDYAIDAAGDRIFVQNAELHSHGFTASDLGMACYRNAVILRQLVGREVYAIERRIAFQNFDARRWASVEAGAPHVESDRETP